MNILFVLIPLAILLAGLFVAAFFWAVRAGQFDDTATPAVRVLLEDRELPVSASSEATDRARA
ncbi:MAG: cbb3-type cytochrome oxidase assembly protein CcoS [Rhodothermales bacterium]|nr:cbb3-type cytochrome oxidase assembly protein CcoS [Rhodothermales bacterium]MBO6781334.1 cbb3-type cytochrome oxidase assembly protein CcoS [Rhodothermales bacterium]